MADVFTASGTKLSIASVGATVPGDAAAFAALTWVEVGLVETIGEYGDESSAVTFAALGDGRVRKGKGARDAGTLTVTCAHDALDAGQVLLTTAEGSNVNYAFKVELANKLNPTGTNEIQYFRGLVMSKRMNVGNNDNIVRRTFNIGVNTVIVTVNPTAGS